MQGDTPSQFEPFKNIALSFSGGGYRAAAFSLGGLTFLNEIHYKGRPLLEAVKVISTVSGGTITGICYAESQARKEDFNEFYRKLYGLMHDGEKLLNLALSILEDDKRWENTHKRRSLINAFAEAYYELVTQSTFDLFRKDIGYLEEVIFNATEFCYALPFRFQNRGLFGNKLLNEKTDTLHSIRYSVRLADVLAASSCFPLGFEPLLFPHDFLPSNDPGRQELLKLPAFKDGLGLMDGGIVDNQGVGSILHAESRRKDKPSEQLGLIIISDVASPYLDPWDPSKDKTGVWRDKSIETTDWDIVGSPVINFLTRRLPFWFWMLIVVYLGLTVAAVYLLSCADSTILAGIVAGLLLGIFVTSIVLLIFLRTKGMSTIKAKIKAGLDKVVALVPKFYQPFLKRFRALKLGLLERMIRERGSSVESLLSDIFLKQVRRLTYYQVYKGAKWKFKRIMTSVYELTSYNFKERQEAYEESLEKKFMAFVDPELKDPGEEITRVAEIASKMPTTLWFEKEHSDKEMLEHLIACGQFTMCYNLLVYLTELEHAEKSPAYHQRKDNPLLSKLYDDLMEYWLQFKREPIFLIRAHREGLLH